MAIARTTRVLQ